MDLKLESSLMLAFSDIFWTIMNVLSQNERINKYIYIYTQTKKPKS